MTNLLRSLFHRFNNHSTFNRTGMINIIVLLLLVLFPAAALAADTFVKLADPANLPGALGNGVAFSADGTYLAVATTGSPYIAIYKRNGDTFTKLSNPASLLPYYGYGVSFSPDGSYLAVAHAGDPFITIYKRSGDTFTKLGNPASLPTFFAHGAAFSPDSTYLAVAHEVSPYITIYKRSGDTFTKLSNPGNLPSNNAYGVSFSPDGSYLAVAHANSPNITIYKRSGDTFTKLSNPATLPTGYGHGVSFSSDSTYLAVAHSTPPYITVYKRSGDTFTKLSNPVNLPPNDGNGVSFSPNGSYLAVAHGTPPNMTIYNRSGDTFTKMDDPATPPPGFSMGAAFSPDSTYLAIGHSNSPHVSIYKAPAPPVVSDGTVNTGLGAVAFTTNVGSINGMTAVPLFDLGFSPSGYSFPYGMFSFNITGLTPGGTAQVTIKFPKPLPLNTKFFKFQNGALIDCTPLITRINPYTLQLNVTDGGLGDADGLANGTIVDPGGPAIPLNTTQRSSSSTMPAAPQKPVSLSNISVNSASLSAAKVTPGTPVTVTASVANNGTGNGTSVIKVYVNGVEANSQGVSVNSGSTSQVSFNVSSNEPGTYTVYVDGTNAGSFIVEEFTPNTVLFISGALVFFSLVSGIIYAVRRRTGTAF
jgi:WD40 repeat protein